VNPINEHDLLTLRQVADALGLPHRTIRGWADRGALDTLQPQRYAERLVPAGELRRLERTGYRVLWAAVADEAIRAGSVTDATEAVA
jgi:predicted transcriptional regulator of viral defense system